MLIACILVRHFPWVCEVRRDFSLAKQPVIIIGEQDGHIVVQDYSPKAIAAGLKSGMTLQEAQAACTGLKVLQADEVYYQDSFSQILDTLENISPDVEPAGLGCAYMSLEGVLTLYSGLGNLTKLLLQNTHSYPTAIGIAQGRFTAYVAAATCKTGDCCCVMPTEESTALVAKASINLLPVSSEMHRRLSLFRIRAIGDLSAFTKSQLMAQFGTEGMGLWKLVHEIDDAPIQPRKHQQIITEKIEFPDPVASLDMLKIAVHQLIARALRRSDFSGRAARQLRMRLHLDRAPTWERAVTLREASADASLIERALSWVIERVALAGAVIAVELAFLGITPESGRQGQLWPSLKARRQVQIEESVRQLKARYGYYPVGKIVEVEPWNHFPERRFAIVDFVS